MNNLLNFLIYREEEEKKRTDDRIGNKRKFFIE